MQMNKVILPIFAMILFVTASLTSSAAAPHDIDSKHWLYMVKTKPSDPARDVEFNAWYDDIDIPDVLAVPGFMRARRAIGQRLSGMPRFALQEKEGKYVALYDIETDDIDKSIIDLYVAARKMSALGRLTDVLKVVEANYYQRLTPTYEPSGPAGKSKYVFIQKIICCRDKNAEEQFYNWYQNTLLPEIGTTRGFLRINLYGLYRIMEELAVGPEEIPHLLAIYEFDTDSGDQIITEINGVIEKLNKTAHMSNLFVEGDSTIYMGMSDVKSK